MQKSVMSVLAVLALFLTVGCQTGSAGKPVDQVIRDNQLSIKATSELVTDITLANIKESDRQNVARYTYAVASGINDATVAGQVDQVALGELSQKLLGSVNVQYRVPVGVLVSYVQSIVVEKVNQKLTDASDDQKVQAFREFVLAASDGVKVASLRYTNGTPTGVVGARSEETGTIKVPVFNWR